MRLRLIAIGTKMPAWVTQGYETYAKRMPSHLTMELIEIPLPKRNKHSDIQSLMAEEGEQILKFSGKQAHHVALDVRGKIWDTETLAKQLQSWQQHGLPVNLWIGGPDGFDPACLAEAHQRWSLSPLTLPHPLVRIIVAEQLYRAAMINANHPYHRS